MRRVQLALNVSDLDAAVRFYAQLFDTEPAKRRPGYANFAIADPPLKLVLIEGDGEPGTLDHLGVEVGDAVEVRRTADRLRAAGLEPRAEDRVTCCFAVQDKVWVEGPDHEPWEVYVVLADAEHEPGRLRPIEAADTPCCVGGEIDLRAPA